MNEEYTLTKTLNLPRIKSAGGLVYNDNYHILLIFKRGKWDLPKGRFELDADPVETALREIGEETGLDKGKLTIKGKLVSTWHTTRYDKTRYLKKTNWYLVHYRGADSDVLPQAVQLGQLCAFLPLVLRCPRPCSLGVAFAL